ncbi:MAG: class I SAM-dependent methyltransferase [Pirellula sp.]|nr:class I SAM-dependent methyltransferase [Pirellula sp.]
MFSTSQYQLIDFGNGRKLEQINGIIVDRPSPGAVDRPLGSPDWEKAELQFDENRNRWNYRDSCSDRLEEWFCEIGTVRMRLKPTSTGQIGIFPEHWEHWNWIASNPIPKTDEPIRVLNLFAYTGATSLALASQGYSVTHVDSSKPTVAWARENCAASGLGEAPIRWIVDDALKFVEREVRRGSLYEIILLDPPTFGHGTNKQRWEVHRDLPRLLNGCWKLLSEHRRNVLLTGHSQNMDLRQLARDLEDEFGSKSIGTFKIQQAYLMDQGDRKLDCGYACKFCW